MTRTEWLEAYDWAHKKFDYSRKVGYRNRIHKPKSDQIHLDSRAIFCERAVARHFGIDWSPVEDGAHKPDLLVGGIRVDVKSTEYPRRNLCLHDGINTPVERYILTLFDYRYFTCYIIGWCTVEEYCKWRYHIRPTDPYWLVDHQRLHPMKEWTHGNSEAKTDEHRVSGDGVHAPAVPGHEGPGPVRQANPSLGTEAQAGEERHHLRKDPV